MNITRKNYEAYFLDYHEGNLADHQVAELMEFLAQNPALQEEFEAFEMIVIEEDAAPLPFDRNVLKKGLNAGTGFPIDENMLIAYHEGDLEDIEKKHVLKAVTRHPEIRKSFALYKSSYLQADTSIVFPSKKALKKHVLGSSMQILRRVAVAAALLTFMATLYFLLPRSLNVEQVAQEKAPSILAQPEENPVLKTTMEELPVLTANLPEKSTQLIASGPSQKATPNLPLLREVTQLALITPKEQVQLATNKQPAQMIAMRDEFYWFSYAGNMNVPDKEEVSPSQATKNPRYTSLTDLAYSGIERSTGLDIKNMESPFTNRNFGLWDIAGMGLAGISQITGTSLTIDKETDENGRITSLGIGDRFKISR